MQEGRIAKGVVVEERKRQGWNEWKCIVGKDIMEQLRHSIKLSSGVLLKNTR